MTFQPVKCTWTVHDMIQDRKGKWIYRDAPKKKKKEVKEAEVEDEDDEPDDMEMMVTQLTGDAKTIQLLKSGKAVKNLGLFTTKGKRISGNYITN